MIQGQQAKDRGEVVFAVLEVYAYRLRGGRHYLHGHPVTAITWRSNSMEEPFADERTHTVVGDTWQFGLTTIDEHWNHRHAMKPTKLLTSRIGAATRLRRICPRTHKHTVLLVGGAAVAAKYIQILP